VKVPARVWFVPSLSWLLVGFRAENEKKKKKRRRRRRRRRRKKKQRKWR
jgi:hypothetical protein